MLYLSLLALNLVAGPGVGGMKRGWVFEGSEPVPMSAGPSVAGYGPVELSAGSGSVMSAGTSCLR